MWWLVVGILLFIAGRLLRGWLGTEAATKRLNEDSGAGVLILSFVMERLGALLALGAAAVLLYFRLTTGH